MLVHKVIPEHSCYAHLFICYLWLCLPYNDRVVVTETTWPTKVKIFTIWPLEKCVPTRAPGPSPSCVWAFWDWKWMNSKMNPRDRQLSWKATQWSFYPNWYLWQMFLLLVQSKAMMSPDVPQLQRRLREGQSSPLYGATFSVTQSPTSIPSFTLQ